MSLPILRIAALIAFSPVCVLAAGIAWPGQAAADLEVGARSYPAVPALRVKVDPACDFSDAERRAIVAAYEQAARASGYAVDAREEVLASVTEAGVQADGTRYLKVRLEGIGLTVLNPASRNDLAERTGAAAMRIVSALHGSP